MATKKAKRKTATKRTRNAKPLFHTMTLGALKKLHGNNDKAEVVVSRNYVLAIKKEQIEADAADELGIEL